MTKEVNQKETGEGLSRRKFIRDAGILVGGTVIGSTALLAACGGEETTKTVTQSITQTVTELISPKPTLKVIPLTKKIGEIPVICVYCAVGCNVLASSETIMEDGKQVRRMVNIEGDPDDPMSQGSMCQKTQALVQMGRDNPRRLKKVLYRAPGASDWEEKSWDWALDTLARRIKDTRDATFEETDSEDRIVNRTDAICMFGGGNLGNADCQLITRMNRSVGINRTDHNPRY